MEDNKRVFIDTNILVFANVKTSTFHEPAKSKLINFVEYDYELFISNQTIREYLPVLSRPDNKGKQLANEQLITDIYRLRTEYTVLYENDRTLNHLLFLRNSYTLYI